MVITFTQVDLARRYRDEIGPGLTVLIDPDRSAYTAYGLERGRFTTIWGWRSLRAYTRILRRRGLSSLRRPVEDTRQLGGDFVVDAQGRLVWAHHGRGPDDRPTAAQVAASVRPVA